MNARTYRARPFSHQDMKDLLLQLKARNIPIEDVIGTPPVAASS